MTKVSVLVAVYNAEHYITKCLASLTAQTLKDIQIICVDDCSTDNSADALRRIAATDSRIDLIFLSKNSGPAHARNAALDIARGELVCMVDADDWLGPDALEEAAAEFDKHPRTDCVLFTLVMAHKDRLEPFRMLPFTVLTGTEALRRSILWNIHGLYMTRTEINRKWRYDEKYKTYSEDNVTHLHYYASREVRLCTGRYYYRQHPSSITHVLNAARFNMLRATCDLADALEMARVPDDILDSYENKRWLMMIDMFGMYYRHKSELSPDDRKYAMMSLREAWFTINWNVIESKIKYKFGMYPFRKWWLIRTQEWIYFTLRRIVGRL